MDNYPKTSWIWSPDTEAERIVYATKVAASGFYNTHGFVVVKKLLSLYPETCVLIPDLGYDSIAKYWEQIAEIPLQFPMKASSHLRQELLVRMGKNSIDEKLLLQRKEEWEQIEIKWWDELGKIFSEEIKIVGKIEVILTNWGTISSNSFLTKKVGQKLIVYLREDASVAHLAEAIINAILYAYHAELGISWSKREAIIDFLLSRQGMKEILPGYKPTLANLGRISAGVREESARYCEQLGIPRTKNDIERLKIGLTTREGEIIQMLWDKKGEIVSFDTIADKLWGEGEFRTYWAINKLVQRIRIKLSAKGIDGKQIVTKRGRGYVWNSG